MAQIFAVLPESYPHSACESVTPAAPSALATVDCGQSTVPGGPKLARYSVYPNLEQLNAAFDRAMKADDEIVNCPGLGPSPTTWHYGSTPDDVAGQLGCGKYQGNADITWSYNEELILADVQSDDLETLHTWWNNDS